jgi:hypothetical protein
MVMPISEQPRTREGTKASDDAALPRWLPVVWTVFVIAALLTLPVLPLTAWGVAIPGAAAALLAITARAARGISWLHRHVDLADLTVLAVLYLAVVGLFRLAFTLFTTDNVAGLFVTFALGLLLGVGDRWPTTSGSGAAHCAVSD